MVIISVLNYLVLTCQFGSSAPSDIYLAREQANKQTLSKRYPAMGDINIGHLLSTLFLLSSNRSRRLQRRRLQQEEDFNGLTLPDIDFHSIVRSMERNRFCDWGRNHIWVSKRSSEDRHTKVKHTIDPTTSRHSFPSQTTTHCIIQRSKHNRPKPITLIMYGGHKINIYLYVIGTTAVKHDDQHTPVTNLTVFYTYNREVWSLAPPYIDSSNSTRARLDEVMVRGGLSRDWQSSPRLNLGPVPDRIFWHLGVPVSGPRLHFWDPYISRCISFE